MTLPYSDALFIQAFPRECTESFLEGHKRAFEFFGGVPTRISYDNSKITVAKITAAEYGSVITNRATFVCSPSGHTSAKPKST